MLTILSTIAPFCAIGWPSVVSNVICGGAIGCKDLDKGAVNNSQAINTIVKTVSASSPRRIQRQRTRHFEGGGGGAGSGGTMPSGEGTAAANGAGAVGDTTSHAPGARVQISSLLGKRSIAAVYYRDITAMASANLTRSQRGRAYASGTGDDDGADMHRRLDKASSATLITWILFATALIAMFVTLAFNSQLGWRMIYVAFVVPWAALCIVTAWLLDESTAPICEIQPNGLDLSPVFSNGMRIPWAALNTLRIVHWHYNYFFRVPFMSWIVVSLHDSKYIAPHLRWMPTSWFGRILIPLRFVKGGSFVAEHVIGNANDRVIEGRLDRGAQPARVPPSMPSADAAIARALAARGGAAEPASAATQPEPARADPRPDYRPAQAAEPIVVNGVPYHPNRPTAGGFGRKRR